MAPPAWVWQRNTVSEGADRSRCETLVGWGRNERLVPPSPVPVFGFCSLRPPSGDRRGGSFPRSNVLVFRSVPPLVLRRVLSLFQLVFLLISVNVVGLYITSGSLPCGVRLCTLNELKSKDDFVMSCKVFNYYCNIVLYIQRSLLYLNKHHL